MGTKNNIPAIIASCLLFLGTAFGMLQATASADNTGAYIHVRADVTQESEDVFRVTVYQNSSGVRPAVLAVYLTFDNNLAEPIVQKDSVTNNAGLVTPGINQTSTVRIDAVYHASLPDAPERACIAMVAYHADGGETLHPGAVFSFSMRISQDARDSDSIQLEPVLASSPIRLGEHLLASSAANLNGVSIAVMVEPVSIPVACVPPEPPGSVRASWRYRDAILVTWTPANTTDTHAYRVYRSDTNDSALAMPLTDAWQQELTYTDDFQGVNKDGGTGGCGCVRTAYHYWVRARDMDTGCESGLSASSARGILRPWWLPSLSCTGAP